MIRNGCLFESLISMKGGSQDKKGNPLDNIKIIEQKREERRIKMEDLKKEK